MYCEDTSTRVEHVRCCTSWRSCWPWSRSAAWSWRSPAWSRGGWPTERAGWSGHSRSCASPARWSATCWRTEPDGYRCRLNHHLIEGTAMSKALYTAEATVTGGRDGHGRSSDGVLDVALRRPTEMGGEGGGTNPEQLFAVGYAACFEGALGVVARRERIDVGEMSIDSRVSLHPAEERGFKLGVALDVTLPGVEDSDRAAELVAAAHQVCPYSNATRGNIEVALSANGRTVE